MSGLLIVVPTLNEATHIGQVLRDLLVDLPGGTRLVVVDGGSTDGTAQVVADVARADARVIWLHNPGRLQSAGVNLAVARHGAGAAFILRADAHARYPAGFVQVLLEEVRRTGAASIVVPMRTVGQGIVGSAVAAAQNSLLGTGGSAHRGLRSEGRFVDHGHHALMLRSAFDAVGGYDGTQSHNEDAELDHRLRSAGFRIWLTGRTWVDYVPRARFGALFRQYLRHGKGRARTVRKHRMRLKPRQALPLLVPPATLLAGAGLVMLAWHPGGVFLLVPALVWAGVCIGYGAVLALRARRWSVALAGPAAMVMHLGWAIGFYRAWFQ